MKIVFWSSLVLFLYPYLIYPIVIKALSKTRHRGIDKRSIFPYISIVIAAYNEEQNIERTLVNKLALNYPKEKVEIIVVSDASTDRTNEIVRRFADKGVTFLQQGRRQGKAACLNVAVAVAKGEIIVFSDANSLYDRNALKYLAENFADRNVGYVTGTLVSVHAGSGFTGNGMDLYMRYEEYLRRLETDIGSVVGVNGGVDAIRRSLYRDVASDLITDFVLPLSVQEQGFRVVYDPRFVAVEEANGETKDELRMRIRVAVRAWRGLFSMKNVLNPFRYPITAFSIISHKIIRYLSPVFVIGMVSAVIYLSIYQSMYRFFLVILLVASVLAVIGLRQGLPPNFRKMTVVPAYLALTNYAFLIALFKLLRGEKMAIWKPRAG